jgi:hypothetical protein
MSVHGCKKIRRLTVALEHDGPFMHHLGRMWADDMETQ